ncbi:acetolactate synthase, large subunit, biosynthetic type [Pradoshia eiseniae]|uniref:Acetolactate synthase n=1 Tax=Pradoshia eiseniae TaxID=2064768 RepID=A0A2S7N2X7_9BACI|nr:acetolactate synthase large subunit [Pradoshia eiseniae]PQD96330.1 acetolactate synthase, large subunit, biosynthetic type [Pradoshia eiseniae]
MMEKAALAEKEVQSNSRISGAEMLINALKRQEVEVLFGYPGGAVLPIYDSLYHAGMKHVLSRHEQGAIHAAEGYARISGKPGVVIATSGPGATNLVTGITDAMMDSLPLVIFTGQVGTGVIGTDAFQEADIVGITTPVTKHNYQIRDTKDIPRIVKEAFYIASTGRPGPVLIDIPKDIAALGDVEVEPESISLPGYQPTTEPNYLQIRRLVEAVSSSKKPLILAGAGVLHAKASKQLLEFAEQQQIPVVNTLLGLGTFPPDHPLYIGMGGMHGIYAANMAMYECDLLINIGARFDDRLTGNLSRFAPYATVAHIDIDPAEIGKNVPTAIPVVGDAKQALLQLVKQNGKRSDSEPWRKQIHAWLEESPYHYEKEESKALKPQRVMELIYELSKGDAIVTTDVGQHQMWAAQYYPFKRPNAWVTSGGLGTMGFGLPAAIGAQMAEPDDLVISINGDGGVQMSIQELGVIAEHNLPIKIIILNNGSLGMVRQWQEIFYDSRYSQSVFASQPSFSKLAEAYGIKGIDARTEEEVKQAFTEEFPEHKPVLINVFVEPEENVYPMIAPGKGINEMVGVKKR